VYNFLFLLLFLSEASKKIFCSCFSRQGGGTRNGTCYTDNECIEKGGIASGGCAQG